MDVDTYEGLTLGPSSQTEGGERTYGAKDVAGNDRRDLARLGIRPEELEACAARDDDFLLSCAGEVANDGLRDGRRGLEGEVVEMHGGRLYKESPGMRARPAAQGEKRALGAGESLVQGWLLHLITIFSTRVFFGRLAFSTPPSCP